MLHTYRLAMTDTGLETVGQYLSYADLAIAVVSPGEGERALQKGLDAGVVPNAGSNQQLLAEAKAAAGRDRRDLPKDAAAAAKGTLYSLYSTDPRQPGAVPDQVFDGSTLESDYAHQIPGLQAENFDEFTLGYEREIVSGFVGGVRGVYRTLIDAIEDAEAPTGSGELILGNPGRGTLSSYPRPERTYTGLEFTLRRTPEANPWFLLSYVLSRNAGNYPGLFNSDFEVRLPNANKSFDYVENLVNGSGRLPNDRTHVVKLSASYRFDFNLTAGVFILWESGTPLSEFGGSSANP